MTGAVTPLTGLTGEQTLAVLAAAASAPSPHGIRPWRLVADAAEIGLHLDRDSSNPPADPDRQQALLACGAALLNLRLAIRVRDRHTDVRLLPDPQQPDLLAVVRSQGHRPALPVERRLAAALSAGTEPPTSPRAGNPAALRGTLHRAAATEQTWLVGVAGQQRVGLAGLLAQVYERGPVDRSHRTGNAGATSGPGDTVGARTMPAPDPADGAPSLVAVIGSVHDTTRARLQAGQACQRVALTAAASGYGHSSLPALIAVSSMRAHLRSLIGGGIWPQAALHIESAPGVDSCQA